MRLQILILTISLFLKSALLGQVDYTRSYYPFINRAELSIIDSNYRAALHTYDSAFQQVPKAFARDYFNAAVCALKLGDQKHVYRYCDSLIAKGVPKTFFQEHNSFESLRLTKKWTQYLNRYGQAYQQLRTSTDTSLAPFFQQLHNRDQEFRKKPGSYIAYRDTINKIDSQNIAALRLLIATQGFPNENMIAISDPRSVQIPAYIVFHHYCQGLSKQRVGKYNFVGDFIHAVRKGELNPHRFAFLISLQGEKELELEGWGVTQCTLGEMKSKLLVVKYNAEKRARIDSTRLVYGLEPLNDYYKKAVFSLRNERAKTFAFDIYRSLNVFEMADEEQYEKFIAASEVLE